MPSESTVYLAETSDDLEYERGVLREELEKRGIRCLPDRALPSDRDKLIDVVRAAMQAASLSIHLVGQFYGRRPNADERSVPHIQYDVAMEVAEQAGGGQQPLELLTWIPEELQTSRIGGSQGRFLQSLLNDYDTAAKPIEVFYSYAHEDEEFVNDLRSSLVPLERKGIISCWHDRDIAAGQEWDEEILTRLESARLILLLISRHFMASEYIFAKELTRAMELHEVGEARVLPIILRPTDFEDAAFSRLQALPTGARPITKWEDRDEAFLDIVRGIRKVAEELQTGDIEAAASPAGGEVVTESFEKFKEIVLNRFPTSGPPPDFSPAVYVTGGPGEYLQSEAAQKLCEWLRRQNFGVVVACTEGELEDQMEHEKANIAYSDGFLIYAGDGPVSWVQPKALLANRLSRRREKPVVAAVYNNSQKELGINVPGIDILDGQRSDVPAVLERFVDRVRTQFVA